MTSEDVPSAALPEVIESLPKITVTQTQIGESEWFCSELIVALCCVSYTFHDKGAYM